MMDDKKIQEIGKRYDELPEDVQKALFSTKTSDAIFEVGKKYGILVDKMGELADETGLVMLGMTKPSEYIRNLEKRLEVEAIKAKEIAEDINQKIFSPIRESLKKIHGIIPKEPIPENLPVEITPTPPPAGGPPPSYSKREGEKREGVITPISPIIPTQTTSLEREKWEKGGEGVRGQGGARGGMKEVKDKVDQILKNHEAKKQARKHIMPEQPADVKVGEIAKGIEPKIETKPSLSGHIETITPPIKEIPDIFVKKIPLDPARGKPPSNDPYKESVE